MSMDEDRQIGRTTGQLTASVARARAGETVVFVCPHDRFARAYAIPLLIQAILRESDDWKAWISQGEIRFDSGGRVMFADPGDRSAMKMRGLKCAVVVDHAAPSLDPAWEIVLAGATSELQQAKETQ